MSALAKNPWGRRPSKRLPTACLAPLLSLLVVVGCSSDGTKTGNGMQMEFATARERLLLADAGALGVSAVDRSGAHFRLDRAELSLGEIELRARDFDPCPEVDVFGSGSCGNKRFSLREPIVVDLLTRRSTPSLDGYVFPAGVYDRIEARIEPIDDDAGAHRTSFRIVGALLDGEAGQPFVLSLKRSETLRFEEVEGVDVAPGRWLSAQVDLVALFAALPIFECISEGKLETVEGVLMLDDQSGCSDIERALVDELRASTRLTKR